MSNTILMKIEKNIEAKVPEAMRVIEGVSLFLVQSYSEDLRRWITQAEWLGAREAMQDCAYWYLKAD